MSELTAVSGVLGMGNLKFEGKWGALVWFKVLFPQSVSYASSNSITWNMLEVQIISSHHRLTKPKETLKDTTKQSVV